MPYWSELGLVWGQATGVRWAVAVSPLRATSIGWRDGCNRAMLISWDYFFFLRVVYLSSSCLAAAKIRGAELSSSEGQAPVRNICLLLVSKC